MPLLTRETDFHSRAGTANTFLLLPEKIATRMAEGKLREYELMPKISALFCMSKHCLSSSTHDSQ